MDLKLSNGILLLIALIIIVVAIIIIGPNTPKSNPSPLSNPLNAFQPNSSSSYPLAPELAGISGYINTNSTPITISQLRGKVVLIDFWTYTCINCIRTIPYLNAWYAKYAADGLVIIGVHSPEFDFEKDNANVIRAVAQFGIKYPVVQDNNHGTWDAFGNQYWPHVYLIDKNGYIRYDHIGEGGDDQIEQEIQGLLSELNQTVNNSLISQNMTYASDLYKIASPEIYLGYQMARQQIGNPEGFVPGQSVNYSATPGGIVLNVVYFNGTWKNNPDNMELAGDIGQIILNYHSKSVNIVAGSGPGSDITISLDGQNENQTTIGSDALFVNGTQAVAHIDNLRLYNIVNDSDYNQRILILHVKGKGFRIYTFTFG